MPYALAGSGVIHEILNDEVIIANLDIGIYYSIRGSGVQIWQLILEGKTLTSIESILSQKYGSTPSVAPFIERLLQENLIIHAENTTNDSLRIAWPLRYQEPILERYDEMKNLLMLDPIHEVDEQGWPHRK
jgi:hypothetical protein